MFGTLFTPLHIVSSQSLSSCCVCCLNILFSFMWQCVLCGVRRRSWIGLCLEQRYSSKLWPLNRHSAIIGDRSWLSMRGLNGAERLAYLQQVCWWTGSVFSSYVTNWSSANGVSVLCLFIDGNRSRRNENRGQSAVSSDSSVLALNLTSSLKPTKRPSPSAKLWPLKS